MALETGKRIGAYEIQDLLGAGGMGEVYRARDTRLDRTVAIKILQGHLALDDDIRQRFEREAKVVSSLNHPNICTLFDVGHQDGMDYLVMEFLDGESMADRLARGPMPLPELLKTAVEIADALDRAHRQGLVHRDLKPGNIMLTKSGAKLLDFGLARITPPTRSMSDLSSPTMSRPITAEGTIVGTFQYMAPELLEGGEADARSDIFSFGAVLYEMATGRRPFEGRSQASLIAAILKESPRPISTLMPLSPPALDRAVSRCLEKDPNDRWQTARDLLLDLKWVAEAGSRAGIPVPVAARRKSRERLAWTLAGAGGIATALLAFVAISWAPKPPPEIRFFIPTSAEIIGMGTPKVSPDGRCIAYNAADSSGVMRLWIRPMGSLTAQPLSGTENAQRPFWSPDSRYLGFMAEGKLKKIAVAGGPPQTICDSGSMGDGSWSKDGMILFDSTASDSLRRVPAAGGQSAPATYVDRTRGETGNAWPQFLPDGRHFLFLGLTARPESTALKVGDLTSRATRILAIGNFSRMDFVPGYILYVKDRALLAQPFDTGALKFTGEPFPVVDDVAVGGGGAANAEFSASRNGVLVFRGGAGIAQSRFTWVDRAGHDVQTAGEMGPYGSFQLAPDGKRIAFDNAGNSSNQDIWILEAGRDVTTRFTFSPTDEYWPVWSPDGSRIAYASNPSGRFDVFVKGATGAQPESLMATAQVSLGPSDWSSDGRTIACVALGGPTSWDIWVLPTTGERPHPLIATPFREWEPRFSPDGRWIAYSSNESGRREIYVQPYPGLGGKWQVSNAGGRDPEWRRDGKELFFVSLNGTMMAVDVVAGSSLELGSPKALFSGFVADPNQTGHNYSVSTDGQRFLVKKQVRAGALPSTTVFMNWTSTFAKR